MQKNKFWLNNFMVAKAVVWAIVLMSFFRASSWAGNQGNGNWSIDVQSGGAYNFPVPLHFRQGSYDKKITADYSTRPFGGGAAPYYSIRVRKNISENESLGFEWLHHKLWLDNRPAEVAEFRMTFGYNPMLFTYFRRMLPWLIVYAGVGPVIAHPVNTVNGKKLADSPKLWPTGHRYEFVGAGMDVGAEAFYFVSENFFLNTDIKSTYSYAWSIPLVDGNAKTHQASLHFHLGVGASW